MFNCPHRLTPPVETPFGPLDWARFILGAAVLAYAARSDVLTRRVNDRCWWAFLAAGLVLLEVQLLRSGEGPLFLLAPFYILVFFVTLWYEGEVMGDRVRRRDSLVVAAALNAGALAVLGAQIATGPLDAFHRGGEGFRHFQLVSVPLMMLVAYMLYRAQLLSGGADAKAFLSMAVLVPFFPDPLAGAFSQDPLLSPPGVFLVICPFVLAVFFNAAFLSLLNPVAMFLWNLSRGDRGRLMAFAYKVPISGARRKRFIWLSECYVDGRRTLLYFRFRGQTGGWKRRQLDRFERDGQERVWVQPQIPFMVQLCAGFVFTFVLGNVILFWLVRLFAGA
ncbi:MAG: hypothetical protein FJ149_04735 [Euryarchaeota archaeon]|nr:hypothetical protein [Euryarchaeota archaeon]